MPSQTQKAKCGLGQPCDTVQNTLAQCWEACGGMFALGSSTLALLVSATSPGKGGIKPYSFSDLTPARLEGPWLSPSGGHSATPIKSPMELHNL